VGAVVPVAVRHDTEGAALVVARLSGGRVEVLGERSAVRQVFANPDGTLTSETSVLPRWVRRADGSWVVVDTTLRRRSDGLVVPVASPFDVVFSGGGDGALARVSAGGRSVALSWPGRLPVPAVSGDTATYAGVLAGVDLRVTATVSGFSEVLVVRTRAAAAALAASGVDFGLSVRGVTVRPDGSGGLSARDASGAEVFHSPVPVMWDSAGVVGPPPAAPAAQPRAGNRRVAMVTRLGVGTLRVLPDRAMLTDPRTVFPVFVDPAWSGGKLAWAEVDKAFPSTPYYNSSHRPEVGSYGSGVKRSFFRMDSDNVNGKHVLSATFRITETYSWSCSPRPVDLYLTGSISSSTTWNSQPSWKTLLGTVNAAKGYSSSCPTGDIEFDVTSAVVQAAASGWSNTTLGLRAKDETDEFGWKGFGSSPSLVVDYNTPPQVPSAVGTSPGMPCVTGAGRPLVNAGTAASPLSLQASVYDPDNADDSVRAEFTLAHLDTATGTWVDVTASLPGGGVTTYVSSSSPVTLSVSVAFLSEGESYSWRVRAFDGTDASDWSGSCEFTVDTANPGQPPVVSSTDYPADTPDSWQGGVGRAGVFTFSPGAGDTDVVGYRYAVDDPAKATAATQVNAPAPGQPVSVQVTPMHDWLNTLYVFPVDSAGNVGAVHASYDFYVAPGSGPVAYWAMDETSGTTAADATGTWPATLAGGASWTGAGGRLAGALHLDGSSGVATTAGPVVHTDRNLAVSAWVRLTSTAHNSTVVSQSGTTTSGFVLYYSSGLNRWAFNMQQTDGMNPVIDRAASDQPPQLGVWTHLAGVFDATTHQIRLYVNGVPQSTPATHTSTWDAAGAVQVGRERYQGVQQNYLAGDVDEVKVFDRLLSDDPRTVTDPGLGNEIAALAKQPPAAQGGWSFDEATGTTGADTTGSGHTVTLTGGATWATEGHDSTGSALALDGTGYAATAGPVVRTDHSFAVSAWVRLTDPGDGSLPTHNETAVAQDGSYNSGFYLGYRYSSTAGPAWRFAFQTADSTSYSWVQTASDTAHAPVAGEWTHLVGVYDEPARTVRLYVNGQLVDQKPYTTPWNAGGPLQVGRVKWQGTYTDYWPGDIDNVTVYTGTLTDRQVLNLFFGLPPA
jgi:hypothetical protein